MSRNLYTIQYYEMNARQSISTQRTLFLSTDTGTIVKQADVILLGYPLNVDMDILVRRNDLKKYEKVCW